MFEKIAEEAYADEMDKIAISLQSVAKGAIKAKKAVGNAISKFPKDELAEVYLKGSRIAEATGRAVKSVPIKRVGRSISNYSPIRAARRYAKKMTKGTTFVDDLTGIQSAILS